MSTAGIYNYNPKVTQPNTIFPQMASASLQPSFFFGGSQVPVNLGYGDHMNGEGFHAHSLEQMKYQPINGRGIYPHTNMRQKIVLPKHMSTIRKDFTKNILLYV